MRPRKSLAVVALFAAAACLPSIVAAGPATPPPPLPAPTGTVVNVSTESQLQAAVAGIHSNTTIVLAPGTYTLSSTLYINGAYTNVGIRGATENFNDVVLVGQGMSNASYGAVPYGIWSGGGVQGITIANLTIREIYYHPIMLNAGTQSPLLHNVHLVNAGEQFVKSNPDGAGGGVNNGTVEYSLVEYTTASRDAYTNGIDVHTGAGWTIRHNLFRNLRAPAGAGLAGPAILMWNSSSNATVEGNTFIDCQREISMGLIDKVGATDNSGGVARNNFIYRSPGVGGDSAILVADSPSTKVVNNTILVSGGYPSPIEYRFASTTGAIISNNLLDGIIQARDGAAGSVTSNVTNATSALFVNPATADLHLKATATAAIDKGSATQAPPLDWDGDTRPQGTAVDVGADEYRAGTTTTPPPAAPTNVRIIR
jgi:hypothetical protein